MKKLVLIVAACALAACGQSTAPAPPSGPQYPNAQPIIERLALIDACLTLAPDRRVVTINTEASRTLRLSGEAGDVDCVVPDDATDPANATVLPALDEPSADAIQFVRAPGENPGGECYQAPEVRDARGQLLGWVLDPEGC
ncbi:MAG: hypothetical protein KF779_14885 [Hyphomonadaceae bacterium]|nr:hypothetical protein [Hyphomonadaceae bacterium]